MSIVLTEQDLGIIRQIEEVTKSPGPVPAPLVRTWLSSPSLPVRGAAMHLVLEHSRRIVPPLSMEEICAATEAYYRECLIRDVKENAGDDAPYRTIADYVSDYVPNRSIAGQELVRWFRFLWSDPAVPREYLVRLKTMLQQLILEKKVPLVSIVNSVLEHLFEVPEVQEFFAEWKSDPTLAHAFALGKEWGDDHLIDSGT